MQRTTILLALALSLPITGAHALTPQQEKMRACNAEATGKHLKDADRKAFMKACLAAGTPGAAGKTELTPQQQKMQSCNASATAQGLKGPARKAFLSECLANGPAKPTETPAPSAPPAPAR